jgi:hypothetical protein
MKRNSYKLIKNALMPATLGFKINSLLFSRYSPILLTLPLIYKIINQVSFFLEYNDFGPDSYSDVLVLHKKYNEAYNVGDVKCEISFRETRLSNRVTATVCIEINDEFDSGFPQCRLTERELALMYPNDISDTVGAIPTKSDNLEIYRFVDKCIKNWLEKNDKGVAVLTAVSYNEPTRGYLALAERLGFFRIGSYFYLKTVNGKKAYIDCELEKITMSVLFS